MSTSTRKSCGIVLDNCVHARAPHVHAQSLQGWMQPTTQGNVCTVGWMQPTTQGKVCTDRMHTYNTMQGLQMAFCDLSFDKSPHFHNFIDLLVGTMSSALWSETLLTLWSGQRPAFLPHKCLSMRCKGLQDAQKTTCTANCTPRLCWRRGFHRSHLLKKTAFSPLRLGWYRTMKRTNRVEGMLSGSGDVRGAWTSGCSQSKQRCSCLWSKKKKPNAGSSNLGTDGNQQ